MKRGDLRFAPGRAAALAALPLLLLLLAGCPTVQGMYGEAYSLFASRDDARALALLDQIVEKDARYVPAYVLMAAIYETRGDWGKSEEVLVAAQRAAQPSAVVCFNLGNVYFRKGDFRKAAAQYTLALELDSSFAAAYMNRANAYMGLQDREAALNDYQAFLGLAKKDYPNVKKLVELLRRELKKDSGADAPTGSGSN